MKAFYVVKRDGTGLWVKMYTDNEWPYFCASCPIKKRSEAKAIFQQFVQELRRYNNE